MAREPRALLGSGRARRLRQAFIQGRRKGMNRMQKMAALACATALSVGGTVAVPAAPAAAALPVFDVTNYTQNILQAARALEQVNNQIKSLQNEATMLQNMARNLERIDFPQLQQISASLK